MRRWILLLSWLVMCLGCSERTEPIRVGAKEFDEQRILAHAFASLIENEGDAAKVVQCDDTWNCRQMLLRGQIDMMVEYSGTALRFAGVDPKAEDPLARLRKLDQPKGLTWMRLLPFENAYRLYVHNHSEGRTTIESLADRPVRFAVPREFTRRPGDGLAALTRRHGLRLSGPALLIDNAPDRYRAAVYGRADVAVGYTTDAAREGMPLRALKDSLGFFPGYKAGVVARTPVLESRPAIQTAVSKLAGWIDEKKVRRMIYRVEVEGRTHEGVARSTLANAGLIGKGEPSDKAMPIQLAVDKSESMKTILPNALLTVRRAFSSRSAAALRLDNPIDAVAEGRARLAVVGAEAFFEGQKRDDRLEAAAVVGTRVVHALARKPAATLAGRVGMTTLDAPSGRVLSRLVGDRTPVMQGTVAELVGALEVDKIDVALVLAPTGDPELREAIEKSDLRLLPVDGDGTAGLPFMLPARIAADVYAGQPEPVDTVASQVVIAATARAFAEHEAAGGPATALPASGSPLSKEQVAMLVDASSVAEAPHPALPSSWTPPPYPEEEAVYSGARLFDTILNILAFAFLGFWFYVFKSKRAPSEAL